MYGIGGTTPQTGYRVRRTMCRQRQRGASEASMHGLVGSHKWRSMEHPISVSPKANEASMVRWDKVQYTETC
jgi:hypothetical protein